MNADGNEEISTQNMEELNADPGIRLGQRQQYALADWELPYYGPQMYSTDGDMRMRRAEQRIIQLGKQRHMGRFVGNRNRTGIMQV